MISISRREQVAQIRGKPIYSISEVALIPLSSQSDAEQAITRARQSQQRHIKTGEIGEDFQSDSESSEDDREDNISLTEEPSAPSSPPNERSDTPEGPHKRKTSIAEDVIQRRGLYGRFAQKWFSRGGWAADSRQRQGMSSEEDLSRAQELRQNPAAAVEHEKEHEKHVENLEPFGEHRHDAVAQDPPLEIADTAKAQAKETRIPMLPKVLTVSKMFFSSKSFYFAYDYDLSRSLVNQPDTPSSSPLHRTFDHLVRLSVINHSTYSLTINFSQFFWNRHLVSPFVDAGQNAFVLPLIQGFIGQRAFTVNTSPDSEPDTVSRSVSKASEVIEVQTDPDLILPPSQQSTAAPTATEEPPQGGEAKSFLLTLVSRRSVKRAGVRYLRRGIDEEGSVANSVETEQILSVVDWDTDNDSKVYSFVQYRGSIPLFFSQSPYSLKPVPVFYGSEETNAAAFRLHFQHLAARYGNVQVASLVEKKGAEATIGALYEKYAQLLNDQGGIDGRGTKLNFEWFDFHGRCKGMHFENVSMLFDTIGPTLNGYGWTVSQGEQITQAQGGVLRTNCMDCLDRTNVVQSACGRNMLEAQLKEEGVNLDLQNDPRTSWFNSVWADNGDAISRQYAGTAALKGDFTRTRKRNIQGALTDFGLTLSRYYNNIVNDYFAQAVIDYILGRADESIFVDFEADMKGQDYAVDLRKVRQNAIDTCAKICVEENEDLLAGLALSCPAQPNTLRSLPFEECVLLLTKQALYFCRMDWATEKVRKFERIELECIEAIARGTYITSTLASRDVDEKKNVGFVIRINTKGKDLTRVNTRSMSLAGDLDGPSKKKTKNKYVSSLSLNLFS